MPKINIQQPSDFAGKIFGHVYNNNNSNNNNSDNNNNINNRRKFRSLEVKLPTIWTDEKQRWEEAEKRRRKKIKEEKVSEERRSRCAKR
jgi:hypothetical protein